MPAPAKPFPHSTLVEAIALAQAIRDKNAGKPMNRVLLAEPVGLKPASSNYRVLLSSAHRWGLTEGTEKSTNISLSALGQALTAPRSPEERARCVRDAFMNVPLFKQLAEHFANNKVPEQKFLANTLNRDPFNVPAGWAEEAAASFIEHAKMVGLLKNVSGSLWLVEGAPSDEAAPHEAAGTTDLRDEAGDDTPVFASILPSPASTAPAATAPRVRRVFISHGKNQQILDQLKELVQFGKFEPVVSKDGITVSKPVPQKVMDDMRSCTAGVIHVAADRVVAGEDGKPARLINENVLIEIGAAMALYGRDFILLVEEGTDLPSNLQGLFEVRYSGDTLDGAATMRLLRAFNDFGSAESVA